MRHEVMPHIVVRQSALRSAAVRILRQIVIPALRHRNRTIVDIAREGIIQLKLSPSPKSLLE